MVYHGVVDIVSLNMVTVLHVESSLKAGAEFLVEASSWGCGGAGGHNSVILEQGNAV